MLFKLNKITTVAKIVIKARSPSKTTREIRKPTIIERYKNSIFFIIGIGLPV